MDITQLRAKLRNWENLGPFRTVEDLRREMENEARDMDASAASLLVSALLSLEEDSDQSQLDALLDFLEFYARLHAEPLAEAGLSRLSTEGPPVLIELLGRTHSASALPKLRGLLNRTETDDDLLVAVASALGDIGGDDAKDMLHTMSARANLSEDVRKEVEIALANLALEERLVKGDEP